MTPEQRDHYRRLMALPGVTRTTIFNSSALGEVITACRGAEHHGQAKHMISVRTGTEVWYWRPTADAHWIWVGQDELFLCGPARLVPAPDQMAEAGD